jgi:hypothetical protein
LRARKESRWRDGMAQFLQSRRMERVKLDRYPGRAAMLSTKIIESSLSRYNCLGMSAKNCAKQITPIDRVMVSSDIILEKEASRSRDLLASDIIRNWSIYISSI